MEGIQYRFASGEDCGVVMALLEENGLPYSDIEPLLKDFTVAVEGGRIIGVAGVQPCGPDGLFRSFAVSGEYRSRGIGKALYDTVLVHARELGLSRLYLLTTTAASYFSRHGFIPVSRDSLPEAIRQTEEFSSICPASAECMVLVL